VKVAVVPEDKAEAFELRLTIESSPTGNRIVGFGRMNFRDLIIDLYAF
jgi:hypothetical protein